MEFEHIKIPIEPVGQPTKKNKKKEKLYRAFKRELKTIAEEKQLVITNPLSLTFIISAPASYTDKDKAKILGQLHDRTPHLTELINGFYDALKINEKDINCILQCKKIWGKKGGIIIHKVKQNEQ